MISANSIKSTIISFTGLDKDALHIYVAVLVLVLVCLWRGWNVAQWRSWWVVFVVALSGEALDIYEAERHYLWGNWHDLWNTMLVPTILILTARYTNIFERNGHTNAAHANAAEENTALRDKPEV